MSPDVAKRVASLLVDALEQQAKEMLPAYLTESFLAAASDLLEKGLLSVWVSLLEQIDTVKIESELVEIIDHREDSDA
jgi:hypothetical protein